MSTPIQLQSESPQLTPTHHHHVPPHPSPPPLNLPLQLNLVSHQSLREPPHYSSLIGKSLCLDKNFSVSVEEVIAEGGFGVIFLAKGAGDKNKYALKRVVVNSCRDYEAVLGEVALMSVISPKTQHLLQSLTHMVIQYSSSSSTTYEIQNLMPLCKQNLLQIASQRMQKSQNFEAGEILQILTHVSSGLQFLHTASPPIIHRDIKIENVLLLEETYVLSDFGSATCKLWDPQVDSIQAIQEDLDKNTTLQYRSPEMVDLYGGRGPINVASDIWALGVCGFKLMSFKDPFESILAIQNRNLNWSTTKSRYPDNMVLLIECLLAEHQSVRPTVDEVIKITTSALSSDWTPLQAAYNRITEEKKRMEQEASVRRTTQAANVVMETTVTPRQRPKRNLGNPPSTATAATSNSGVIIPPVLAPPKSPKPVISPSNTGTSSNVDNARFFSPPAPQPQTISPTQPNQTTATPSPTNQGGAPLPPQQPQQQMTSPPTGSGGGSYNPFDDDYRPPPCDTDSIANNTTASNSVSNDDGEFDVFANAPFDYFKYQPIMMSSSGGTGHEEPSPSTEVYQYQHHYHHYPYSNYAPNNPFLYPYDMSNNNAGVCNLSFDDGIVNDAANNTNSSSNNNKNNVSNSDS